MNVKMIRNVLLKSLVIEGIFLLIPMAVSIYYREECYLSFLIVAAFLILFGGVCSKKRPQNQTIYAKEGFFIVGLVWILWSVFGAIPFVISGAIPNPMDAFFETVSGFTTTGATVLTKIESLPKGLLFWRSFTNWIGGMGVLVFVIAIVPMANSRSMYLMKAELPGPSVGKLVPKSTTTAKILYTIYMGMTLLEIILLVAGGMPLFDSILHAFGTAGTGGFNINNASIAAYKSAYIDGVISVFMLMFGINLNLFYLILIGKVSHVLKSEELWTYLGVIASAILMITINISHLFTSTAVSFRYASFQVISVISTTAYKTMDYNLWPYFSQIILLILMVLGACAGSTGGGIKIARFILVLKSIHRELKRMVKPHSVSVVKVDGKVVEEETIHGVHTYMMVYILIFFISFFLVAINGFDIMTTLSAVLASMNNIGIGFGELIGSEGSFWFMSSFSKIILCLDMLIGRLEIFPIILLAMPSLWKRKSI